MYKLFLHDQNCQLSNVNCIKFGNKSIFHIKPVCPIKGYCNISVIFSIYLLQNGGKKVTKQCLLRFLQIAQEFAGFKTAQASKIMLQKNICNFLCRFCTKTQRHFYLTLPKQKHIMSVKQFQGIFENLQNGR